MLDATPKTNSCPYGLTMRNQTDTVAVSIEARTIRKVRIRILPFILILYIVAFLDRINIGFAALTMNAELGITSQQFGFLVGLTTMITHVSASVTLARLGPCS